MLLVGKYLTVSVCIVHAYMCTSCDHFVGASAVVGGTYGLVVPCSRYALENLCLYCVHMYVYV